MENPKIQEFLVFNGEEVAAGGSLISKAFPLVNIQGYFSLKAAVSGDGTVKFEYMLSFGDDDFITFSDTLDVIASGITKTSGPGSDGKDIYPFSPPLASQIKIKVTETGASNAATVTAYLGVQ